MSKTAVHTGIIVSISTKEYTGRHASRTGNTTELEEEDVCAYDGAKWWHGCMTMIGVGGKVKTEEYAIFECNW